MESLSLDLFGHLNSLMQISTFLNLCRSSSKLFAIYKNGDFWKTSIRYLNSPMDLDLASKSTTELIRLYYILFSIYGSQSKGYTYTWGTNNRGCLGTGNFLIGQTHPKRISNHKVTQISCGYNHTGYVTDEGHVYVCGSKSRGKLGLGPYITDKSVPSKIPQFEDVSQISCGGDFTAFITKSGKLYTFGIIVMDNYLNLGENIMFPHWSKIYLR